MTLSFGHYTHEILIELIHALLELDTYDPFDDLVSLVTFSFRDCKMMIFEMLNQCMLQHLELRFLLLFFIELSFFSCGLLEIELID